MNKGFPAKGNNFGNPQKGYPQQGFVQVQGKKGGGGKKGFGKQGYMSEADQRHHQAVEQHRNAALEALAATSKAIVSNTVSTSKKKKAQQKAEAAKARKLMNPLSGEALMRVQEKTEEVQSYHENKRQSFVLGGGVDNVLNPDGVRVTRTPEATLRKWFGLKGLDLRHPWRKQHFKFSCVYDVQIQDEEEDFTVVARMGGNDGENLRNIVRMNKEVNLTVKGSKTVPLHVKIDCDHQEAYEYSMRMVEIVLKKVYLQLDAWAVDKDHVGRNIELQVSKVEKNTDYESIMPDATPAEAPAPAPNAANTTGAGVAVNQNEAQAPRAFVRAQGVNEDAAADGAAADEDKEKEKKPVTTEEAFAGLGFGLKKKKSTVLKKKKDGEEPVASSTATPALATAPATKETVPGTEETNAATASPSGVSAPTSPVASEGDGELVD